MDQTWVDALDLMERDIDAAERLVATRDIDEIAAWQVPDLDGPLPEWLRDRATALLRRQEAVLAAVADASFRANRQLSVTDRIGRATRPAATPSVFIDTSA